MVEQTFEQSGKDYWVTAVQVATVWTNPESTREIDGPGISNPTNIDEWIHNQTYEERVALCDENRVQSQLLYGEKVIVTEVKGDWAHVVITTQPSHKDIRGYPGWVPLRQLKKVTAHEWDTTYKAAVTDRYAWLETEDGEQVLKISFQTHLPYKQEAGNRVEVKTPHGSLFLPKEAVTIYRTTEGLPKQSGTALIQSGSQFLGLSYFWGGMSAFGYDCSGFTYAMHRANGYQIPRDAGDQAAGGEEVPFEQLAPGDLLFFAYEEGRGRLHHVGMYSGNGQMLHAPMTEKQIEMLTLEGTNYEKELCLVRRYWQGECEI